MFHSHCKKLNYIPSTLSFEVIVTKENLCKFQITYEQDKSVVGKEQRLVNIDGSRVMPLVLELERGQLLYQGLKFIVQLLFSYFWRQKFQKLLLAMFHLLLRSWWQKNQLKGERVLLRKLANLLVGTRNIMQSKVLSHID